MVSHMALATIFEHYMAVHSEYGEAYGTGKKIWGLHGSAHPEYGESYDTDMEIWGLCGNAHSQYGKSNGTRKII
jgi:hypothetical protein